MTGTIKKALKNENGAVQIVEATFVFPIMFIILFFLIYMGNAYYVKAQVESVVSQKAIEGAEYCADPLLETIIKEDKIPTVDQLETKPYRYIMGEMQDVEDKISGEVKNAIEGKYSSFFGGMKPVVKTSKSEIAKYNNYVLYSTFSVDVKCNLQFPIRFLGKSTPYIMTLNSHAEIAVNDATEFIRNTDMVIDYFEDSKLGQSIKSVFDKINDFIDTFAKK